MPDRRRLAIAVAALAISLQIDGAGFAAAATRDQIETIADMATTGDLEGLAAYLEANPELLEEPTPLAVELRRFALAFSVGTRTRFAPEAVGMLETMARRVTAATAAARQSPFTAARGDVSLY